MVEVIAYEMKFDKAFVEQSTIACIPFEAQYFEQYKRVYNECFYDMRKALEIEPYNFLNDYEQIREKVRDIYLLVKDGEIIGSVACYGNEIDDLIVSIRNRVTENSYCYGACNRFERRILLRLLYMWRSGIKMPLSCTEM